MTSFAVPRQYKEFGIIPARSKEASTPTVFNQSAFTSVSVRAKAYVVYDIVDEKIISEKNGELSLPLASITKVMTALTARIHAPPNAKITISQSSVDGGYDLGLKKNQVWKLDELLKYSLVFSSNDGAQAIADGLGGRDTFVKEMNNDAILLGLQLQFTQPAGLDIGGKLGGEGSAYEVAKLFAIARRRFPEVLDATTKTRVNVVSSTGPVKGIPNTNQDIENLLGAEASKTGFTDEAGGNLAVVVDVTVGRPVAIVVLGSTREERFSDMEILYKALQKSLIK
jgi:D-alanyl-D-alanine carboxypeptidase